MPRRVLQVDRKTGRIWVQLSSKDGELKTLLIMDREGKGEE